MDQPKISFPSYRNHWLAHLFNRFAINLQLLDVITELAAQNAFLTRMLEVELERTRGLRLRFAISSNSQQFEGTNMLITLLPNGNATGTVLPVDGEAKVSTAALSNVVFESSDPSVATIENTDVANVSLIRKLAPGTTVLTATALATEADGRTNTITGQATLVLSIPTEPTGDAESLVWSIVDAAATPSA